jgi:hypothetical protein
MPNDQRPLSSPSTYICRISTSETIYLRRPHVAIDVATTSHSGGAHLAHHLLLDGPSTYLAPTSLNA